MRRLTKAEAIEMLDAIVGHDDPEVAHIQADEILLEHVDPKVRDAYERLTQRTGAWWYA